MISYGNIYIKLFNFIIINDRKGRPMKISSVSIKNVGGIKNLELKFNLKLNLICGANGVGKTTIINCISNAFNIFHNLFYLKKYAGSDIGEVNLDYIINGVVKSRIYKLTDFAPSEHNISNSNGVVFQDIKKILLFNSNRELNYVELNSVDRDPQLDSYQYTQLSVLGINSDNIKSWFVNRHLFSFGHDLNEQQLFNFVYAKKTFSIIDNSICFKQVKADTFDIIVETPKGEIYFEYLSSGYKSCIYVLMGIIKEIEFRFKEPYIKITDFDGIILIDEVDMHLHPQWQAKLLNALKEMLPNAQIIATTHSPSMLQTISPDEIIVLDNDDRNNVYQRQLNLGTYGLQGWTIEEILTDIMGLSSTSSELYTSTLERFDKAMDDEDKIEIMKQYHILDEMIHPKNPLKRLLKIQVAEWED